MGGASGASRTSPRLGTRWHELATAARNALPARRPDYLLLALVAVLLMIGLQALFSASFVLGLTEYGNVYYFVTRQIVFGFIGLVALVVFMRLDYHHWRVWSAWIMLAALAALVMVLLPGLGKSIYGSTRWIQIGSLPPIQPSEGAKLALVIYVSSWLATRREAVRHFASGVIPFVAITAIVAGLVLVQPDLGTAMVILFVAAVLFFLAGASLKHLAGLALGGAIVALPLVLAAGYRQSRMQAFLDPWSDPQGKGFHIIQSLIALGSGGIMGLGLGSSRQKFSYVPGSHTDAIFAIIGEELGLVGSVLVIGLFAAIAYRGFKIVFSAPDEFGALMAAGITSWLAFQAMINIGGITRSIPFTGITLPFISYGGSSLAVSLAAVGILLNISNHCLSASDRRRRLIPQ
ncbi:MAG: putative lipid II flippase FtsW [Chloroflexi bacterium]|nr:putative lipid II flippase FtsW [Chloroflexota bacterium]